MLKGQSINVVKTNSMLKNFDYFRWRLKFTDLTLKDRTDVLVIVPHQLCQSLFVRVISETYVTSLY
jgi:hypothetical protein